MNGFENKNAQVAEAVEQRKQSEMSVSNMITAVDTRAGTPMRVITGGVVDLLLLSEICGHNQPVPRRRGIRNRQKKGIA